MGELEQYATDTIGFVHAIALKRHPWLAQLRYPTEEEVIAVCAAVAAHPAVEPQIDRVITKVIEVPPCTD